MNMHHLHLHPKPFDLIKSGNKTIESRLFDEKRQSYRVGDICMFTNRANESETLQVEIINLMRANNFKELFSNPEVSTKSGGRTKDELLKEIEKYYSDEDQNRNGVVGIEFIIR